MRIQNMSGITIVKKNIALKNLILNEIKNNYC